MTLYKYQSYNGYVNEEKSQSNLDILIRDFNITGLTPTKLKYGGITRAGLFSYFGSINGKKVKIYSSFTDEQADLRVKMNEYDFTCKFPKILGRCGNVLIDEWVNDGKTLNNIKLTYDSPWVKKVLTFMEEFKDVDITPFNINAFDYLEYLKIRIKDSGDDEVEQYYQQWEKRYIDTPTMLCHNDLFSDNLVLKNNDIYIVDNEMLGISKGWCLSWKNSFFPKINVPNSKKYTELPQNIIEDMWALRKIGTTILGKRK